MEGKMESDGRKDLRSVERGERKEEGERGWPMREASTAGEEK